MGNSTIEDGWQRFLDRLKRLWGRLRDADLPTAAVTGLSHVR